MSTRVAVMHGGVLQQFGTPAEIYHAPANAFVAEFIGTPAMTLVEGEIVHGEGRLFLKLGDLTLELPPDHLADGPNGVSDVHAAVRPEDVLIGTGDVSATIRIVEPTGHETIVLAKVGGDVTLTIRVSGDVRLRPGDVVPIDFRRDRIHVFDRQTGLRLNADHGGARGSSRCDRPPTAVPIVGVE
jgi:multiple sugar transport system ATP-binding protein